MSRVPGDAGAAPSGDALSADQREAVAAARARARLILRAARVASVNGWTIGAFGALTVLLGLGSPSAMLVGVALVAVAWNELRGRRLLRSFDPRGARRLAANQLILGAVVIAYCAWALVRTRAAPSASARQIEELAGLPEGFIAELAARIYGAVIVVMALAQGLLARFHVARVRMVETYLAETPAWVVELQRLG